MPTSRRPKQHPPATEPSAQGSLETRVLKKYPNRRLYDTQTSSYITLQDVKDMVLNGQTFAVQDAKTAEDITRSILLQIILEEETAGVPLFSTPMLATLIRFYGHAMQGVMGRHLEHQLETAARWQLQWTEQSKQLLDPTALAGAMGAEAWSQWTQLLQSVPGMSGLPGMNPITPRKK